MGLPGAMLCHSTRARSAHIRMALLMSSLPFIADHRLWLAAFDQQPVQLPCHADAGERRIDHQRQAFAGASSTIVRMRKRRLSVS
jgi:hypothetical protein